MRKKENNNNKDTILVIDDDSRILLMFERILKDYYNVISCNTSQEAVKKMKEGNINLIICDQSLEDIDGIKLLIYAQKLVPNVPFIVITGYGSIERAVECVKKGAYDYILKPFGKEKILKVIKKALEEYKFKINKNKEEIFSYKNNIFSNLIIGKSEKMKKLFEIIRQVAPTNATILIQGESGTGKELIAKAIHKLSNRKDNPFVAINCGVLNENLLENELFGHVKGAFTGATAYKKGLIQEAEGGTLFLDEIAEMPLSVQSKLLRVLQEKEFKPLGSNEIIKADVRIIAATNVNLYKAVKEGKFREDLYYRLAVIPIIVPPLRERKEDIPHLALHFLNKYNKENNKNIKVITDKAINKLLSYNWPGNVRELENTIERAVALSNSDVIDENVLWCGMSPGLNENISKFDINDSESSLLKDLIEKYTEEIIINTLKLTKGNRSKAAKILGISRTSLYNKLKNSKYNNN